MAQGRGRDYQGHTRALYQTSGDQNIARQYDFVLDKDIFSNIFEKDIRRVFIYKKAERLAKALHLIAPAFADSASLKDRIDAIAIGLVDAAVLVPGVARTALSRELLALSSVLSIARVGGLLSPMNADLIAREAHTLLQDVATYEDPRVFLDEAPTLSGIARETARPRASRPAAQSAAPTPARPAPAMPAAGKGQAQHVKDRREAVLAVIRSKGRAGIKDISTLVRGVSEKTIQRELAALVADGVVRKEGERRWSVYSIT